MVCGSACTLLACDPSSSSVGPVSNTQTSEPSGADVPMRPLLPKVVFLGDSISAGLHLAAEQAFPALLKRRFAASKLAFEVVNAGVSGDTTAGGLRRVDWLLKQSPRVVVLELGANDGMRGVPVSNIEANLREIIGKLRAADAKVLLLGMRIPPSYGTDYVADFEAIYPRIAKELEVDFVPFFMEGVAGRPELNLPDGIHPTPEGHERLASNLAEPLRVLLAQLPAQ